LDLPRLAATHTRSSDTYADQDAHTDSYTHSDQDAYAD
jgi:hypothetical protein